MGEGGDVKHVPEQPYSLLLVIALNYIIFVLFYCTVTCWKNGQDSTFIPFYTWNFHLVALKIHKETEVVVSV